VRCNVRNGGYTLIEVLVAFVILAMALAVLLRIFSGGLHNVSASSDYGLAILVAEAQLSSAGVTDTLVPGETHGDAGEKFRWTRIVRSYVPLEGYAADSMPLPAYHVTVIVEWPHADGMRQVDISSIRLAKGRGAT
jgi:general secretion pathway protein I